jgi:hypothetical protein
MVNRLVYHFKEVKPMAIKRIMMTKKGSRNFEMYLSMDNWGTHMLSKTVHMEHNFLILSGMKTGEMK